MELGRVGQTYRRMARQTVRIFDFLLQTLENLRSLSHYLCRCKHLFWLSEKFPVADKCENPSCFLSQLLFSSIFCLYIIKYIVDILFVILAKLFIFAYWFSICCHLSTGRRNVYSPASASAPASVSTLLLSLSFISSEMFIIIENK